MAVYVIHCVKTCDLKPKAYFSGEDEGMNVAGPSHIRTISHCTTCRPALPEREELISDLEMGGQYHFAVNLYKWSLFLLLWLTYTTRFQLGISVLHCK